MCLKHEFFRYIKHKSGEKKHQTQQHVIRGTLLRLNLTNIYSFIFLIYKIMSFLDLKI